MDFHYEVNGEMYDFSIPGGGFTTLENVVEVLGIDTSYRTSTGETVKLGTKEFVSKVESVSFSSPALVDVSRVDNDTSVGEIKNSRGLACEYSAELSEEDIEEINGSVVEAGDWAMISLKAFSSDEMLTVRMVNGDEFEIRVTDAAAWTVHVTVNDTEHGRVSGKNNDNKDGVGNVTSFDTQSRTSDFRDDGARQLQWGITAKVADGYTGSYTFKYWLRDDGEIFSPATLAGRPSSEPKDINYYLLK